MVNRHPRPGEATGRRPVALEVGLLLVFTLLLHLFLTSCVTLSKGKMIKDHTTAIAIAAAATAISFATYFTVKRTSKQTVPPGPARKFIVGNLGNFPKSRWYETFSEWQTTYGDLIYAELMGSPIVIVNSLEIAEEMGGKRAAIWSCRPHSVIRADLMEYGWPLPMMQPGKAFDEQRSILRKALGPRVVPKYDHLIEEQADLLVKALSGFTGDPLAQINIAVRAVIIKLCYGDRIHRDHVEDLAQMSKENVDVVVYINSHFWFVNTIPFLRYLPKWTPGAKFHQIAARGKAVQEKVRYWAFGLVKEQVEAGNADQSLITQYLDQPGYPTEHLRDAVAVLYSAGTDTTNTAIIHLLSQMLMNPDVQKKVHHELDETVGRNVRPTVADCRSMPYLNAVWNESFRLNPPVPLGIPHLNSTPDTWNGYTLPKGTTMYTNIGFMMRDPRVWGEDANQFKPERFLKEYNPRADDLPDAGTIPFGFGRRICPGLHIAKASGMTLFASLLSEYEIVPPSGESIPSALDYTDGTIRRPSDFKCYFKPRA